MANSIGGGAKIFTPRPPAKGSFPLDHFGECKDLMSQYMKCLNRSIDADAAACQNIAKDYLACRMDKDLMAKEDFKYLGFGSSNEDQQQSSSSTAPSSPPAKKP